MKPAIDPDDGLALGGERAGLIVSEPLGQRETTRDVLIAIELVQILRRRDDGHPLDTAFFGAADINQLHAIRFTIELLPVLLELRVRSQEVVVADRRAELLPRRGDRAGGRLRARPRNR